METRLFKTTKEVSGKVKIGNRCPVLKPNPEASENLWGFSGLGYTLALKALMSIFL